MKKKPAKTIPAANRKLASSRQSRTPALAHPQPALGEGLNQATHDKILSGAVIAVARRGTKKLGLGDICDAAGVSRGTLYRYFSTKEQVLHAMGDYVSSTFERGVVEVARRHSNPADILRAVLEFQFSQTRQSDRALEVEPLYVMGLLRDHFARHMAAMKAALKPVFEYISREAGVPVHEDLVVQMLIRVELSTLLVPADALWNSVPERATALMEMLIGITRQRAGTARG